MEMTNIPHFLLLDFTKKLNPEVSCVTGSRAKAQPNNLKGSKKYNAQILYIQTTRHHGLRSYLPSHGCKILW